MRIRIIAVIAAVVIAVVGAVVLVVAVRGGGQASADGSTVPVLVVTSEVPSGTSASALTGAVEVRRVPTAYAVKGAVSSLKPLLGKVASTTLEPGEQVLATRFSTPAELSADGVTAAVPKGMQAVSVAVDVQRLAGGTVGVGDHVGVYASFASTSGTGDDSTGLLLDHVLVTSVTSSATQASSSLTGGSSSKPAATGTVLVTVALSGDDAKKFVYAAEFGKIWFSAETADSTSSTSGAITRTELGG